MPWPEVSCSVSPSRTAMKNTSPALEVQVDRTRIVVTLPCVLPTSQVEQLVTLLMNVTSIETELEPSVEWQNPKNFKRGPSLLRVSSLQENLSNSVSRTR